MPLILFCRFPKLFTWAQCFRCAIVGLRLNLSLWPERSPGLTTQLKCPDRQDFILDDRSWGEQGQEVWALLGLTLNSEANSAVNFLCRLQILMMQEAYVNRCRHYYEKAVFAQKRDYLSSKDKQRGSEMHLLWFSPSLLLYYPERGVGVTQEEFSSTAATENPSVCTGKHKLWYL